MPERLRRPQMLKTIFKFSLAIAAVNLGVLFYYMSPYYNHRHGLASGTLQVFGGLILYATLLIWWIVYFSLSKDFGNAFGPIVMIVLSLLYYLLWIPK